MQATATRSIRSVLARAIIWTTGAALAVTLVVVGMLEWRLFQNEQTGQLDSLGSVISAYSVPAFEFDDPLAGEEALAALGASGDIVFAALLRPSGELFATYGAIPAGLDIQDLSAMQGTNFQASFVDWVRRLPARSGWSEAS